MGPFFTLFAIIMVPICLVALIAWLSGSKTKKYQVNFEAQLQAQGFLIEQKVGYESSAKMLYIDGTHRKFAVQTNKNDIVQIFDFSDLNSANVKGYPGLGNYSQFDYVVFQLHINNLQRPLIEITFNKQIAKTAESLLSYIMHN